jgi:hypothetical protein
MASYNDFLGTDRWLVTWVNSTDFPNLSMTKGAKLTFLGGGTGVSGDNLSDPKDDTPPTPWGSQCNYVAPNVVTVQQNGGDPFKITRTPGIPGKPPVFATLTCDQGDPTGPAWTAQDQLPPT